MAWNLEIHRLTVGPLNTNCYLVAAGGVALVVDPGDEAPRILQELERRGLVPAGIVLTHAHFDHLLAVRPLQTRLGLPLALHEAEVPVLQRQRAYLLENFGLDPGEMPTPDLLLREGDRIGWAHGTFTVLRDSQVLQGQAPPADTPRLQVVHTPGHSPGSVCLKDEGFAFVGDLIFRDSVGRADLRGSDPQALRRSLRRLLETWPPETVLYPGHGSETTLGRECRHNPFLRQWFPDLCP